ncbi:DUF4352 domain-containing protein [Halomarina salina]|nr:DUF4352 domain-containing protein [Halomarina salina]
MENDINRRRVLAGVGTGMTLLAGCASEDGADNETNGGDGGDATSNTDESESTEGSEEATATETDDAESTTGGSAEANVTLGEVAEGDNLSLVARSTERTTSLGEYSEAESGNEFVVVRMAVKNTSDAFAEFSSYWQARLKDGENHVYDASFNSTDHPIDSSVLAPGEVSRGDMVFEVPEGTGDLTMQFDFSAFDFTSFDRVTIDLASEASSAADLTQDLGVEVNDPGTEATYEGVTVTLHGVRRESSLGDYAEAEEGSEYVIPDIEITNGTDEALTVSTLLQMRVKTGTGLSFTGDLMGSSSLDQAYEEGSDIAPGESRRGELAYQVETDTESQFWVFNFLDFSDPSKSFWTLD